MFDCFMMNDELDLVEIRLHTLDSVVEKFVIVESNTTHSGKPKEMHFFKNFARFKQFQSKIIHLEYKGHSAPDGGMAWGNENAQRDMALEALKIVKPSDGIIHISDADEIPKPEKLLEAKLLAIQTGVPVALSLHYCMYYLNYVLEVPSRGPIVYNPDTAEAFHMRWGQPDHSPTRIRWHANALGCEEDFPTVLEAGWHFSAIGNVDDLMKKIASCAHIEFDTPEINSRENLQKSIEEGKLYFANWFDCFQGTTSGKTMTLTKRDISFLPVYVQQNLEKFKQCIL